VTSDPNFNFITFFEVEYLKNVVTYTNRKPWLTDGTMFGDLD